MTKEWQIIKCWFCTKFERCFLINVIWNQIVFPFRYCPFIIIDSDDIEWVRFHSNSSSSFLLCKKQWDSHPRALLNLVLVRRKYLIMPHIQFTKIEGNSTTAQKFVSIPCNAYKTDARYGTQANMDSAPMNQEKSSAKFLNFSGDYRSSLHWYWWNISS
jgi:hypothetical protein